MRQDKKGKAHKKVPNSTRPTSSAKGSDVEGQPNSKAKANDCRYVKQVPPDIYVNIPPPDKEKKWQWNLANKIASLMAVVTITYTIFTYLLFKKAGVQADEAIKASNAAIAADSLTREQFEVENRAYILPYDLKADTLRPNGKQDISFTFKNYGKLPAFILNQRARIIVDTTSGNYTDLRYDQKESKPESHYFAPEGVWHIIFENIPKPEEYGPIFKGEKSLYIFGELLFVDMVKHKNEVSSFCFRVTPNGAFIANLTHNDIYELSDSAFKAYFTLHSFK